MAYHYYRNTYTAWLLAVAFYGILRKGRWFSSL